MALPAGRYVVGEGGEERAVALRGVAIGRFPVVNAQLREWVDATGRRISPALAAKLAAPQLADHPATDVTRADADAFCAWASERLGRRARLPTGAEWEALARGTDRRPWPWGDVFDEQRCACAESGWGWTVPVGAHPAGASPFGAEQLAGNVWEWVADSARRRLGRRARRLLPRHRLGPAVRPRAAGRPGAAHRHDRLSHRHRGGANVREVLMDALREVYDPCCADRGISIVDMGVVEDVRVDGSHVDVDLVLTTGWCPFVASMSSTIPERLRQVDGVETVDVQVVWDPVWTMDRLSESARAKLTMPLEQRGLEVERRPARRRATCSRRRRPARSGRGSRRRAA